MTDVIANLRNHQEHCYHDHEYGCINIHNCKHCTHYYALLNLDKTNKRRCIYNDERLCESKICDSIAEDISVRNGCEYYYRERYKND